VGVLALRLVASGLDERRKRSKRLAQLEERMLRRATALLVIKYSDSMEANTHRQQLRCIGPFFGVDLQRLRKVVPERRAKRLRICDLRCAIGRNEVKRLERVLVKVWRLALDHLDRHNTQAPDVDLRAVLLTGDDFGCHPVWRTHHRGALRAVGYLCAETEVGYRPVISNVARDGDSCTYLV
jgi:hypothetical protein